MKLTTGSLIVCFVSSLLLTSVSGFAQGNLTPPGAPAPTMKTLAQIEPRTPISSLPFMITNSGSYYVTTNLTNTAAYLSPSGYYDGIIVVADDVFIDLGGFNLSGVGGFHDAIYVGVGHKNISVRNGTLTDWSSVGVDLGNSPNSRVEKIIAYGNGNGIVIGGNSAAIACLMVSNTGDGIYVGEGSMVENCIASQNGSHGIDADVGVSISGCGAVGNFRRGISMTRGATVKNCNVSDNGQEGIKTDVNSSVLECSSSSNLLQGISVADGSTVTKCMVVHNGKQGIQSTNWCSIRSCDVFNNIGDGVEAGGSGNVVEDCNVRSNVRGIYLNAGMGTVANNYVANNSFYGIEVLAAGAKITGNTCVSNATYAGIYLLSQHNLVDNNQVVTPSGVAGILINNAANSNNIIIRNNVAGNGANGFSLTGIANNAIGPIVSTTGSGTITNSNPWANFSF